MEWTVLAVLTRPETAEAVLDASERLVGRVGTGRIIALHVRHDPMEGFMPSEEVMVPEHRKALEDEQGRVSAKLKTVFSNWVSCRNPAVETVWREDPGPVEDAVAAESPQSNVVAVAHAPAADPDAGQAIHAVLFRARAPLLLTPSSVSATVGRHAAVAWDRSHTAEGALRSALPILEAADRVTILMGNAGGAEADCPEDVLASLRKAGVRVSVKPFDTAGREIGAALVEEARHCGADLLVMGAFGHTRLREFVLGGATRTILRGADIPVLMKH